MVFSLIVIFRKALRQRHITPRRDISHASTAWQIPALSQFPLNSR
jgi:hypothetical protein